MSVLPTNHLGTVSSEGMRPVASAVGSCFLRCLDGNQIAEVSLFHRSPSLEDSLTQAVSGYVENRRYRRYAVGLPCTVRPKGKAAGPHPDLQTKTIDVSRGGLLFSAQTGFEVGATIECLLELPIHSIRNHIVTIRCLGRVVRVGALDGGTVGVGATIDTFEFVNPV